MSSEYGIETCTATSNNWNVLTSDNLSDEDKVRQQILKSLMNILSPDDIIKLIEGEQK
jgi:hypothetical protein